MFPLRIRIVACTLGLLPAFGLPVAAQDRKDDKTADARFESMLAEAKKDPSKANWKALRQAFVETSAYAPYSIEWRQELDAALKKHKAGDTKGAELGIQKVLERDRFMRIDTHLAAGMFYDSLGQPEKERFHRDCIKGIAGTIFIPGQGMSFERPIDVVFIDEEYFFFRVLELTAKRDGLMVHDGRRFDVYTVKAENGSREQTFYFCVDQPQKSLGRGPGGAPGTNEKRAPTGPAAGTKKANPPKS